MNTKRQLVYLFYVLALLLAGATGPTKEVSAQAATPIGWLDTANPLSASGWACDADNYNATLQIDFHSESGYIGSALADKVRESAVGSMCGGNRSHGFVFGFPTSLRDGRTHTIYAYAINYGGGTNPMLNGSPKSVFFAGPPANIYVSQPSIGAAEVDSRIVADTNIPGIPSLRDKFLLHMGFMGTQADSTPVSWNVSQYTGYTPLLGSGVSSYQRGPNNNQGTTTAQLKDTVSGIWINSASVPLSGDLATITPGYWWSTANYPQPWPSSGYELSYAFEMQVPTAVRQAPGEVYVLAYFQFFDTTTSRFFWYGAQVFDPRGAILNENTVYFDGYTNSPIVVSSINGGTQLTHKTAESASFEQAPWSGFRYFEFRISEPEFRTALGLLNSSQYCCFSNNPANYKLAHIDLNPEVAKQGTGNGQLGLAIRNMLIARYQVSAYDRVYIRGANAYAPGNLQVFFKTSTSNYYSEDKSVWVDFLCCGGYTEMIANMSQNSNWRGTITGLRVDPFNANGYFGIDYVYVGDVNRNYVQRWEFNGASSVTNPFFGWTLYGIGSTWTDGNYWGGQGVNGDPFFYTDTNFASGR